MVMAMSRRVSAVAVLAAGLCLAAPPAQAQELCPCETTTGLVRSSLAAGTLLTTTTGAPLQPVAAPEVEAPKHGSSFAALGQIESLGQTLMGYLQTGVSLIQSGFAAVNQSMFAQYLENTTAQAQQLTETLLEIGRAHV